MNLSWQRKLTAPQYFYWETIEVGGKRISNDATNYVMNQYNDGDGKYWDNPKRKVYDEDGTWNWEYILDVNGKHPTVSGSGANLTGTSKADDISNGGAKTNINAGAGNDTIGNGGNNTNIDAGTGNDTIDNSGSKVTIDAGTGNDTIDNSGSKVTIDAGTGNDTIDNSGSKVTIDAGTGKDTIVNHGSNVSIKATADGKGDEIFSGYENHWWYGYRETDGGDNVTILAGAGNDSIYNAGSKVTINAGEGDNYIYNDGSKVIIDAGAGNDSIFNESSSVLINPGDGDNLISIYGGKYITLKTGNNIDSVIVDRYYDSLTSVSIQSGEGKNLISLAGNECSVSLSGGENELYFNSSENVVYTNDKNDSITVVSANYDNTLNTNAGNDIVWIKESNSHSWEPFVVDTSYQNDSIRNEVGGVSIETGYGKDTVENWGQNVTIQSSDPNTATGKNLVKNHAESVTIQGGGDSDTIKNYKTNNVSINGGGGNDVIQLYSLDSMKNIINTALAPLFKGIFDLTLVETTNGIIDTCNNVATSIVDVEKLSNVELFYREKNQSKVRKKLKEISKETGSINDNLKKLEYALDIAGYGDNAGRINRLRSGIGKVKKIADKWLALLDVKDVFTGMGKEYADSEILSTMAKEIASNFEKDEDGNLSFAWEKSSGNPATIQGGKGNDKIYGNELGLASYVYEYKAGDGKDTIFNWNANDTLSISGGTYIGKIVGNDYVVTVGKGSVTFKNYTSRRRRQGYEDLPCQIDGKEANGNYHTPSYTYNNQPPTPPPEGINIDYGNLTVEENFSGEINLAKNYAEYVTNVNASSAKGNVEIIGSDSASNIRAGKGHDKVSSTRSFTVIISGAGKDIISSSGDSNSINSGADNDVIVNVGNENSIDASPGNDTIISEGKKNIFAVNDGGNKVIYGFDATDTLQITDDSGTYSKKTKGNDIIITADGDQITLVDAKALKKVNIKVAKTKGRDLDNDYENELITGTSKADTIRNGGNKTTIDTGAGNDTLHDFDDFDTIVLGSVKINSSVRADDTVTLNLSNKKTLTLTNHWSDNINTVKSVKDVKKINVIHNDDDAVVVKGTKQNDYIDNDGSNVTIDAGAGNDFVGNWNGNNNFIKLGSGNNLFQNGADNVTIKGGAGNDTFRIWGENTGVSVNGDSGDDCIHNNAHDSTIIGGDGNDSIGNRGSNAYNVKILSGAGNDTIGNNSSQVTIDAGDDNDVAENWGNHTTINGGKGNDYIENYREGGEYSSLAGGAGNDSIVNHAPHSTLVGGDGKDSIVNHDNYVSIVNHDNYVSIDGGLGNDTIINDWTNHDTISGGAGNDYVDLRGDALVYVYGDGNDTINNFDNLDTLVLGSVKVNSSVRADSTVTLNLSNKKTLTLTNYWSDKVNVVKSLSKVENWNVIRNYGGESNFIEGTSKADYIENYNFNTSINAGDGNDNISNNSWYTSINGGAGNDTLESRGDYVTIRGGTGNDLINDRFSPKSLFDGGAGNDTINVFGTLVTVTGGADNDKIFLNSTGNLINYKSGDGNDTVYGFNSTDSLSISGGSYSTTASGDDVIVKVGKEKITLKNVKGNAVYINKKNVGGKGTDKKLIVLSSGDDTLNNHLDGVTISGGKGNDVIENDFGDKVSINAGKGNDTIWNIAREEWNSSTNSYDILDTPDKVTINGGDGKDYIYNQASKKVSISGGADKDTIQNFGDSATLNGDADDDSIYNFGK